MGPTPGCVISRSTSGRLRASCPAAAVSSSIVVFNRSTNSSKSWRRRVAHGASGSASSCLRPVLLHSVFLRRTPSFIAAAWIWFMARVRICTRRCRCQISWRRSRFSGLGTQIWGKRLSTSSLSNNRASCRSVFCLRTRAALILAGSPIHSSNFNSASNRSNQRACPVASIPTRTLTCLRCRSR